MGVFNEGLLRTLFEMTKIPVSIVKYSEQIKSFSNSKLTNPLFESYEEQLLECGIQGQYIQLVDTVYFESLLSIPFMKNDTKYWLIIGPIIHNPPTKSSINRLLKRLDQLFLQEEFEKYLFTLKIESKNQLIESGHMAYFIINGAEINIREELSLVKQKEEPTNNKYYSNYIADVREKSLYHHDPLLERRIYQLVEEGNTAEILPYYKAFQNRGDFQHGLLSRNSEMRSLKNRAIAMITLATRAAIRGGVHPEDAYSLGDVLIQDLEELTSISKVSWYREEILYDFTEMVKRNRKQNFSRKVTLSQEYIYKHIYEPDLSVNSIAKKLEINSKYLSNLFKKEVGISISEYIQKSKIQEAQKMMIYFNRSLTEICNLLNFTDQSYFTKIFKRHAQITPKEFLRDIKIDSF
ncbi:AraC family transcriptional regulator [Gracilibacillus kekensis]|uniref:Transcriptional regulator, AraC family n=1 Tax=Gracilibacillus kekensis TaxID=1027249 RepID=A0A1M7JQT2_9BACI|nr:AraC family transcriptional regulator [Gracilibacillus kekensis]SHM55392.1 transcriptional regulator, AraC family [Gracilibacillus kekensis]